MRIVKNAGECGNKPSHLLLALGYLLILAMAALAIIVPVMLGLLPRAAALGLLAFAPASAAALALMRDAARPQQLAGAIRKTIVAAHLAALAMAIGLYWRI